MNLRSSVNGAYRTRAPLSAEKPVLAVAFLVAATGGACAGTRGAQPHDMSAAQHAAAASEHEQVARQHGAQYEPKAEEKTEHCRGGDICWTSIRNPTAEHLADAEKHRKMAADHRAASQALRDAEARACVGISEDDRAMSPFEHREDIESVGPLRAAVPSSRSQPRINEGAVITLRALPGMTAQWLQRLVDCHLARNAALGHDVPEMPTCPLVPKDVTATVSPTATGFAVAVRSEDPTTAQEVLRRAQALIGR